MKTILVGKNNKVVGLTLLDIKIYYKATTLLLIQTGLYWVRVEKTDKQNGLECLETDPDIYGNPN